MNMYVWNLPGFYADCVIAIQGNNEIDALNKLYHYAADLWRQIQVGSGYQDPIYEKLIKQYCLDHLDKIKPHIDTMRTSVINNERNGLQCINYYKTTSDRDLLDKQWWSFSNYIINDFLLEQLDDITKTTKWYIKPQEITTYFYQRPSD